MQLLPTVIRLIGAAGTAVVEFTISSSVEDQLRDALNGSASTEGALDFFGLHAVEAAMLRNALLGRLDDPPDVDRAAYATALEQFGCAPPDDCWEWLVQRGKLEDVVPLRGDYLKAFRRQSDNSVDVVSDPGRAIEAYRRLRTTYKVVGRLARYGELASHPSLAIRPALWMLKAATIQACRGGAAHLQEGQARQSVSQYLDLVGDAFGRP